MSDALKLNVSANNLRSDSNSISSVRITVLSYGDVNTMDTGVQAGSDMNQETLDVPTFNVDVPISVNQSPGALLVPPRTRRRSSVNPEGIVNQGAQQSSCISKGINSSLGYKPGLQRIAADTTERTQINETSGSAAVTAKYFDSAYYEFVRTNSTARSEDAETYLQVKIPKYEEIRRSFAENNKYRDAAEEMTSQDKEFVDICDDPSPLDSEEPPSYSIFAISGGRPEQPCAHATLQTKHSGQKEVWVSNSSTKERTGQSTRAKESGAQNDDVQDGGGQEGDDVKVAEKEEEKTMEEDWMEMKNWRHFTRNTTLHGIKYVFMERSFTIRRLIWLVCVLTAFILFGYQAITRVCTYFQYPSNVNVQVVYKDHVQFPAVTICNYNNFRLSEVVSRGLYPYIDGVYRRDYNNPSILPAAAMEEINVDEHDRTEFVLSTAHQKGDFIYGCTWQGLHCNIETNFTTTMTDFGVCYTFNNRKDEGGGLNVVRAGAGFALSLSLNIEQYEYMSGPEHEAGVKILLHDPDEVPLVKDIGFAVAPGTHTLVAIRRKVYSRLEPPYGTCTRHAPPRSQCLAQCVVDDISRLFGCRDVYMPEPSKGPVEICNMSRAFELLQKVDLTKLDSDGCACLGPCQMVMYEPELSYAHLATLNFVQMSINNPAYKERLEDNYQVAREVSQRVNVSDYFDTAKRNFELVSDVIKASATYNATIRESGRLLSDSVYAMQRYNVSHDLVEDYAVVEADFATINTTFLEKIVVCKTQEPDKTSQTPDIYQRSNRAFINMVYELRIFFYLQEQEAVTKSPLRKMLSDCITEDWMTPVTEETTSANACRTTEKPLESYMACSEKQYTYLFNRYASLVNARNAANDFLAQMTSWKSAYQDTLQILFSKTGVCEDKLQYVKCYQKINSTVDEWQDKLSNFSHNLSAMYLNATSWSEKLQSLDGLESFYEEVRISNMRIPAKEKDPLVDCQAPCGCSKVNLNDVSGETSYSLFRVHMDIARKSYLEAIGIRYPFASQTESIASADYLLGPLYDFLNSSSGMTKKMLCKHFGSDAMFLLQISRKMTNDIFLNDLQQYLRKLAEIDDNIQEIYKKAFLFPLPVFSDSVLDSLGIIRYASNMSQYDQNITRHLDALKTNRSSAMLGVLSALYGRYRAAMQDVQTRIIKAYQQLENATLALSTDLLEFDSRGNIDENFQRENFIKVDIFYKDLSYEHITQQIGFEVMSLFSELGGLLGLLLGASLLTVCELVDFLALLLARRVKASRG